MRTPRFILASMSGLSTSSLTDGVASAVAAQATAKAGPRDPPADGAQGTGAQHPDGAHKFPTVPNSWLDPPKV